MGADLPPYFGETLDSQLYHMGNVMHAVRTQCKVLDVGKYSNPSFGPF